MERTVALKGGGQLRIWEEGTRVGLEATCPDDGRGLYKVWIAGAQGRSLLGTLVPAQGQLCLCRKLSRDSLERSGCWPVETGERVLSFPFKTEYSESDWTQKECPEQLMREPVLRQVLRGRCMLYKQCADGGFCLGERFDPSRPFPVPSLFCMGWVGKLRGQTYVFFYFDRDAMPILPLDLKQLGTE